MRYEDVDATVVEVNAQWETQMHSEELKGINECSLV